ncbi:molybdopterin-dependent oxidoreductase [Cognatishimia sp. SS12]|uniref:molybdopterin-dependent oxidoreductase n=1 Tax=Cognatishimia sp. SS12 TaxID=2979465 RepID=UPI00232E0362|nr:molybdopterin-dependent oxidoreductase [Cognatishimia sp. SS12]MDC0737809.1 molybdopterin-dependent oxidoreductase [Cognatishimia sp. SS12]
MSQPITTKPSVCPLDCPDTCSLSVDIADGQIVKLRGSHANPYTAGVICNKVARYYPDFVHGPHRLRHPLRKTPKGFARISWEEALDLVHAGFSKAIAQHGPQSVLPFNYAGPHGELAGASMDRRFFNRLGASELARGPLCGGVRGAAYESLYGAVPGMPPAQAVDSDLIVIWGSNISVSSLHVMRVLKAARQKGARVVVIDPKCTKVAEQADMFLQVQPGTDVVLGLALAAELARRDALDQDFIAAWVHESAAYLRHAAQYSSAHAAQICGVSETDFAKLVDWISTARAMATAVGVGLERSASGGAALRAAMALNALTGQHGRPGAGVIAKSGAHVPKTSARLQAPHLRRDPARVINILDVPNEILDRAQQVPISAVMVYNHNPVATHPDQDNVMRALSHPDVFVVGCDVVMTNTMALCDVVLPAASHFEHHDIFGAYGQNYLQRAAPVMDPVGESLPNTEIFRRLAARFAFLEPNFQDSDAALMTQAFAISGPDNAALDQGLAVAFGGSDGRDQILCRDLAPKTPTGKIELFSAELESKFAAGLPNHRVVPRPYPLRVISPSSEKRINATFGGHAASSGVEMMEMHPEDAAVRGLQDGDSIAVWNALAEIRLRVKITDKVQPGVTYVAKGAWRHNGGGTINALIASDQRCDLISGAAYNDTFVDVRAVQE